MPTQPQRFSTRRYVGWTVGALVVLAVVGICIWLGVHFSAAPSSKPNPDSNPAYVVGVAPWKSSTSAPTRSALRPSATSLLHGGNHFCQQQSAEDAQEFSSSSVRKKKRVTFCPSVV
jgi:hypothetical protein